MADVKMAVVRGTLSNVISGTTDFTSSGFGTPAAAIVLCSNAHSTANPFTSAILSIGLFDGTNSRCHMMSCLNGQGTTNTRRADATDHVVHAALSGTVYAEYTAANITDGIRLTMSVDATGLARLATVILIGGADVTATVGSLATNTTENATAAVTSLAAAPDVVLFTSVAGSTQNFNMAAEAILSFGCAINDGSETQRGLMLGSKWGSSSATISNTRFETDSVAGQMYNDALTWTGEVTAFAADGFTVTTRDGSSGADYIYWLALNLGGGAAWLDTLTTPTSTGDESHTGPGFTPIGVLTAAGNTTAVDTTAGGLSYCVAGTDGTQDSAMAGQDEDGVATSDTDSETNQRIVDVRSEADGSDLVAATLSSFDGSGFTLNYSAVDGSNAYKGWVLAIGTDPPGGLLPGQQVVVVS